MSRNRVRWLDKWGGFSEGKIKGGRPPTEPSPCLHIFFGRPPKAQGRPPLTFHCAVSLGLWGVLPRLNPPATCPRACRKWRRSLIAGLKLNWVVSGRRQQKGASQGSSNRSAEGRCAQVVTNGHLVAASKGNQGRSFIAASLSKSALLKWMAVAQAHSVCISNI